MIVLGTRIILSTKVMRKSLGRSAPVSFIPFIVSSIDAYCGTRRVGEFTLIQSQAIQLDSKSQNIAHQYNKRDRIGFYFDNSKHCNFVSDPEQRALVLR
jgi:hypothetical protein